MFKKNFAILLFLFLSNSLCFAQYVPIPKDKSKEYKLEIEKALNIEIPKAYTETNNLYSKAKKLQKEPFNIDLRNDLEKNLEFYLNYPDFQIYSKLIEITKKYVNINEVPGVDYSLPLAEFLQPYFKDNNISTKALKKYGLYAYKTNNTIKNIIDLSNNSLCNTQYVPIPKDKSKEYKLEIENIINIHYPEEITKMNNVVINSKFLHDKLITEGYDFMNFHNLLLNSEIGIWAPADLFVADLVKLTYEKYLNQKYSPEHLGIYYDMRDNFFKITKDNNVNLKKITKLYNYTAKQNKIIEKYIEEVRETFPPED